MVPCPLWKCVWRTGLNPGKNPVHFCMGGNWCLLLQDLPASGTDFRFTMISKQLIIGFQNGCRLKKMAPRCFLGQIPRFTGTKNSRRMEDLGWMSTYSAHWNALNGFQCVSMGFFLFRLTMFSLYSDFAGTN